MTLHPDFAVLLKILVLGGRPSRPFNGSYVMRERQALYLINWLEATGYIMMPVSGLPFFVRGDALFAVNFGIARSGLCRVTVDRDLMRD